MVRSFRRGAVAAVLVLSLAPLAAACSAGNDAQSLEVQPDSFSGDVGDVRVQNAFVLTDPSGPAAVTARLFNNGSSAQHLESVQIGGSTMARLVGARGGRTITVPAHGSVLLGGKGNPAAVIDSGDQALRDGDVEDAVFTFSGAGAVRMPVNVTPARGYFEHYGPGSAPTTRPPSPARTATPTTTGTATPATNGTAAPGATTTSTPTTTP